MKKKVLVATAITAALALTACTGPGSGSPGSGEQTNNLGPNLVFSISEMDPEDSVNGAAWAEFTAYVEEETAGRITFETYFSSSLMPGEEVLSGVGAGVADIGRIIAAYFPGELPVANWTLNLGGLADSSFPIGFIQGMMTTNEVYVADGELKSELIDNNLYPLLANVPSQQYDMLCVDPVANMADAMGKKVRTPGGLWSREIEELGMLPMTLPMGEVYEALQRGVIDCAVVQVPAYIDFGLWEVANHYVPVKLSQQNGNMLVINNDIWEKLSAEDKKIFGEASVLFNEVFLNRTIERYKQFATAGPTEHNLVFSNPADLNAIVSEFQQQRANEMVGSAPSQVSDPEGFVENYLDVLNRWLVTAGDAVSGSGGIAPTGDLLSDFANASSVKLS